MPRAPAAALVVTDEDRRELLQVIGLRSVPQSVALRVRIVLGASEGIGNKVLARRLGTSLPTVLLWRGRFQSDGLPGILQDRPRSGRPKQITPAQEAALVETTLHSTPRNATHWSVRLMARDSGRQPGDGAAHLAETSPSTASSRVLQVQHGPTVRRQSSRYRGPVFEPAGKGDRAQRG